MRSRSLSDSHAQVSEAATVAAESIEQPEKAAAEGDKGENRPDTSKEEIAAVQHQLDQALALKQVLGALIEML